MTAHTEAAPAVKDPGRSGRQLVDTIIRARELSLVAVLAVVVLGTTAINPRFLNSQNIRDILLNVAIVALLAVGETVVVVTRNIDLSVGSVLGIMGLNLNLLHTLPGGVWELFVGVWLIVKGFNASPDSLEGTP